VDYPSLQYLSICRSLLKDPVVIALEEAAKIQRQGPEKEKKLQQSKLSSLLLAKAEALGLQGNIAVSYLIYLLGEGKNTAAQSIERYGKAGSGLSKALEQDMEILWPYLHLAATADLVSPLLSDYHPSYVADFTYLTNLLQGLQQASTPAQAATFLLAHYEKFGSGDLARYMAFKLDEEASLRGIEKFPLLNYDDLIGYERQRERLRRNTENFITGKQANNVLLTGARGTGKSTAVKALVNMYHTQGLCLVQISRSQLQGLDTLMNKLGHIRNKKFILFLDDLSFDENESAYKQLKSVIDGGLTPQPDNMLLYATSNRRHLLKETWVDRNDEADEVYRSDSLNEAISLSDRFGLILHYGELAQEEYLQIIAKELGKLGYVLTDEQLRIQGVRWEMEHSGRNGRVAIQFVKWYAGNHHQVVTPLQEVSI